MLEKDATRCMNGEVDDAIDLNEDKSIDTEEEIKVVGESLRSLPFCERMKRLSPHCRPLKDWMKVKRFPKLICFDRVHLHQEQTMKRSPKHLRGWQTGSRVHKKRRHVRLNM